MRYQNPSLRVLTAAAAGALLLAVAAAGQPAFENAGFHVFGPGGSTGPTTQTGPFTVVPMCPNEMPPFLHWDLREFPGCGVPYEVNGSIAGAGQPGSGPAVAAVRNAANTWSAAAPSYITLFDNTGAAYSPCAQRPRIDNRNCVAWNPNFPFGAGVLGVTFIWRNATTGVIQESDITLNPGLLWQASPPMCGPGSPFGIEAVMLHEFGHFLGLAHPTQWVNAGCGNDDPNMLTRMFPSYKDACNTGLHQADRDGINYLYTADHGDAPDPPYPTLVHSGVLGVRFLSHIDLEAPDDGPEHLFGIFRDPLNPNFPRYQYEWLGLDPVPMSGIDDHPLECEARVVDLDAFDDGVSFSGKCLADGTLASPLDVIVGVQTSSDVRARAHDYTAKQMFVNGWIDWNNDGVWDEVSEHVINGLRIAGGGQFMRRIAVPPGTPCGFWSRFRLDWGEDVGRAGAAIEPTLNLVRGAAQHGEVEDYPVAIPHIPCHCYCHEDEVINVFFPSANVDIAEVCHPPEYDASLAGQISFPAGTANECMWSTLTFDLDVDQDGVSDELLGLVGEVCVERSDPYVDPLDGRRVIDTRMLSLDMSGYSELAGFTTVRLAPGLETFGQIRQSQEAQDMGVDLSEETPADTFFDVFFVVDSEVYGTSEPVGAVRVSAQITTVPPGRVLEQGMSPPVAVDDFVVTEENLDVYVDAAANDHDPDGNLQRNSARLVSAPANGTVAGHGNGTFTYSPAESFNGPDSFAYEICDSDGLCAGAVVTVTVEALNEQPIAKDDRVGAWDGQPVQIDVLANDHDVDGNLDASSLTFWDSESHYGKAEYNGDGTFTFVPATGAKGLHRFYYQVCDMESACATAAVEIKVGPSAASRE